jgi:hypothetical protein
LETLAAGTFACEPPRIGGVERVVGYVDDTLDDALARRVGRLALASFGADLESSTTCAPRWLTPLLDPGSMLLFDEFDGGDDAFGDPVTGRSGGCLGRGWRCRRR